MRSWPSYGWSDGRQNTAQHNDKVESNVTTGKNVGLHCLGVFGRDLFATSHVFLNSDHNGLRIMVSLGVLACGHGLGIVLGYQHVVF